MNKFTPAPWHYQEKSDDYTHIVRNSSNGLIAHLRQDTSGEAEADARLISAAPDMYEALIVIRKELLDFGGSPMPMLDAILAKARGESNDN